MLFNGFLQKCCLVLVCQTLMFIPFDYFKGQLKNLGPSDSTVHLLHTSLDAILKQPTGSQMTYGLSQGSETSLVTGNPCVLPGPDNTESETHVPTSYSSGPTARLEKTKGTLFGVSQCLLDSPVHSACSQSPPQITLSGSEGKGMPLHIEHIPQEVLHSSVFVFKQFY